MTADEIERLRIRCDAMLRDMVRLEDERDEAIVGRAAALAERDEANANAKLYRDERDEARREICRNELNELAYDLEQMSVFDVTAESIANRRGWKCFHKENDR